jgi:hypothetical protein
MSGVPASCVTLDAWVARHGPLWPSAALVLTLDACARVSELDRRELRVMIDSLTPAGIIRQPAGWTWLPQQGTESGPAVADEDILERLGILLFCALTGETRVDALSLTAAWRATLRRARPDLPAAVVELTVGALAARRRRGVTLSAFAHELEQALGLERRVTARPRRLALVAALVTVVLVGAGWWSRVATAWSAGSNSLPAAEWISQDVVYEAATSLALVDEHTSSLGLFDRIGAAWRARSAPEDPRIIWAIAHHAWVRTLAGDRLTAEQLLSDAPDWLSRELGAAHPYARAALLELAATLDARRASGEAAALRERAARAASELWRDPARERDLLAAVPAPPGVLAHVTPNPPEREGFRGDKGGGYFAPLTSIQRLLAGRDGWRLHLALTGPCRLSVVAGNVPRRLALDAARDAEGRWQLRTEGTTPSLALAAPAAERLTLSLISTGGPSIVAHVGDRAEVLTMNSADAAPAPPYGLTFAAPSRDRAAAVNGCAVVWLEIPVPNQPGAKWNSPAPAAGR